MNILLRYDQGGLGDTLAILPFAKDFHDQRPTDKLFILYPGHTNFQKQRDQLFFNNPDISLYNGQLIDKEFFYDIPKYKTDMQHENIISKLYSIFKNELNINIQQKTFYIPWYFTDTELNSNFKFDKPICLINSGYHQLVSSKNYGFDNFEKIINALKDKVIFIQIGETNLNGFTHRLHNNVIDLRNKLNLRTLAALLYYTRFVLCHVSSLNIFSGIPSNNHRTIFTFCGNRQISKSYQEMFNTDFLSLHVLESNNQYDCYNNKYCLINSVNDCKYKVKCGDETICKCLNDIDSQYVINKIKEQINEK